MSQVQTDDSLLIECIIKREGGTRVAIGHNPVKQTHYHFKPINEKDPTAPHVCAVLDDHLGMFLAVRESYRRYKPDQEPALEVPPADDDVSIDLKNDPNDLLSITNVDGLDNKWLEKYSTEHLGIPFSDKAKLLERAAEYGLTDFAKNAAPARIVKEIIKAIIEQQKAGANAFTAGNSTATE